MNVTKRLLWVAVPMGVVLSVSLAVAAIYFERQPVYWNYIVSAELASLFLTCMFAIVTMKLKC